MIAPRSGSDDDFVHRPKSEVIEVPMAHRHRSSGGASSPTRPRPMSDPTSERPSIGGDDDGALADLLSLPDADATNTNTRGTEVSFFDLLDKLQTSRIDAQRSRETPFDRPMVVRADATLKEKRRLSTSKMKPMDRLCTYYSDKRIDPPREEWTTDTPPGFRVVTSGLVVDGVDGYTVVEPVEQEEQDEKVIAGVTIQDVLATSPRPAEVVSTDSDAGFFRENFLGQDHVNYVGTLTAGGPVAVSLRRKRTLSADGVSSHTYLVVARLPGPRATVRLEISEEHIPSRDNIPLPSEIMAVLLPTVPVKALRAARIDSDLPEKLAMLDECHVNGNHEYKIGILHCRPGQTDEDAMYNNTDGSDALNQFLSAIATRVRLKDFPGYRGGLDVKNGQTGTHSYAATHAGVNVMFHVSPLLPFSDKDPQQVSRKRHLGNDLVCIVFQEVGSEPIDPTWFRSKFQKVFVVVRPVPAAASESGDGDKGAAAATSYRVSVARSIVVPPFGPLLDVSVMSREAVASGQFREFLLATIINAENACHRSQVLQVYSDRVREQLLLDIATSYTTELPIDGNRRRKSVLRPAKKKLLVGELDTGFGEHALRWLVQVVQAGRADAVDAVDAVLVISSKLLIVTNANSGSTVHHLPILSVFGWTVRDDGVDVIVRESGQILEIVSEDEERHAIHRALALHTRGSMVTDVAVVRRDGATPWGFGIGRDGCVIHVTEGGAASDAGLESGYAVKMVNMQFVHSGESTSAAGLLEQAVGNVVHLKVATPSRRKRSSIQEAMASAPSAKSTADANETTDELARPETLKVGGSSLVPMTTSQSDNGADTHTGCKLPANLGEARADSETASEAASDSQSTVFLSCTSEVPPAAAVQSAPSRIPSPTVSPASETGRRASKGSTAPKKQRTQKPSSKPVAKSTPTKAKPNGCASAAGKTRDVPRQQKSHRTGKAATERVTSTTAAPTAAGTPDTAKSNVRRSAIPQARNGVGNAPRARYSKQLPRPADIEYEV